MAKKLKKCLWCKAEFAPRSRVASYCCSGCRVRHWRYMRRATKIVRAFSKKLRICRQERSKNSEDS